MIAEVPTPKSATPKPAKVVVAEKKEDKKNGSFSIEDKPEFKKLLSSSPLQMSPIVPDGDPPEPEDLIKAIQVNTATVACRKTELFGSL